MPAQAWVVVCSSAHNGEAAAAVWRRVSRKRHARGWERSWIAFPGVISFVCTAALICARLVAVGRAFLPYVNIAQG